MEQKAEKEKETRYCDACGEGTRICRQRFSDLEYGCGHSLDALLSFCKQCAEVFELENS